MVVNLLASFWWLPVGGWSIASEEAMGANVYSGGNIRRITIKREVLEKIAKLLDITAAELKQGSAIDITISTPSGRKRLLARKGRSRQRK
jgi:hypothetical protein